MGDAQWTAMFVTGDVPVEVINSILEAAERETFQTTQSPGELVGNIWVLVQGPDQESFCKPTVAPVPAAFETGFLGASADRLKAFVGDTFGENGLGNESGEHMDWISDNAFAVIDERSRWDHTIAFYVQDLSDSIEETARRVAWGDCSDLDEALARFCIGEESEEDVRELARDIGRDAPREGEDVADLDELRRRVLGWIEEEEARPETRWYEFRLKVDIAIQCTHGIWHRGAVDLLVERDEFDEDGVML